MRFCTVYVFVFVSVNLFLFKFSRVVSMINICEYCLPILRWIRIVEANSVQSVCGTLIPLGEWMDMRCKCDLLLFIIHNECHNDV